MYPERTPAVISRIDTGQRRPAHTGDGDPVLGSLYPVLGLPKPDLVNPRSGLRQRHTEVLGPVGVHRLIHRALNRSLPRRSSAPLSHTRKPKLRRSDEISFHIAGSQIQVLLGFSPSRARASASDPALRSMRPTEPESATSFDRCVCVISRLPASPRCGGSLQH